MVLRISTIHNRSSTGITSPAHYQSIISWGGNGHQDNLITAYTLGIGAWSWRAENIPSAIHFGSS